MRFKVIYVEDGKVKRCFMHTGIPFWTPPNDAAAVISERFVLNEWWGLELLEVVEA
jgi:hypothetical protein